mmetsp:Transcript_43823/g.106274  ORF Transcript_43823/g.106274 Transcript_43823/m.106274 type:complete len:137 (-) Transcript_43823:451-861(-)
MNPLENVVLPAPRSPSNNMMSRGRDNTLNNAPNSSMSYDVGTDKDRYGSNVNPTHCVVVLGDKVAESVVVGSDFSGGGDADDDDDDDDEEEEDDDVILNKGEYCRDEGQDDKLPRSYNRFDVVVIRLDLILDFCSC